MQSTILRQPVSVITGIGAVLVMSGMVATCWKSVRGTKTIGTVELVTPNGPNQAAVLSSEGSFSEVSVSDSGRESQSLIEGAAAPVVATRASLVVSESSAVPVPS